jgi:acetyl esterase/lipase
MHVPMRLNQPVATPSRVVATDNLPLAAFGQPIVHTTQQIFDIHAASTPLLVARSVVAQPSAWPNFSNAQPLDAAVQPNSRNPNAGVVLGKPLERRAFEQAGIAPPAEPLEQTGIVVNLQEYRPPRGRWNGASILILPGGGYEFVCMEGNEGTEVAERLQDLGYLTFILDYNLEPRRFDGRAAGVEPAVADGIAALRIIRERAQTYGMDPSRLGVIGFSAGGHLTTCICRRIFEDSSLQDLWPRTTVVAYAPVRNPCCVCIVGSLGKDVVPRFVPWLLPWRHLPRLKRGELCRQHKWCNCVASVRAMPPTLVAASHEDAFVLPKHSSDLLAQSLEQQGVPFKYVKGDFGEHGFGLDGWRDECENWLAERLLS